MEWLKKAGSWTAIGILAATFLAPVAVNAAVNPFDGVCTQTQNSGAGSSAACNAPTGDPIAGDNGVLVSITNILATVAGIVATIFVIWGGFKYITANGDSSQISTAKKTIIYALVGAIVALLARPLINLVLSRI